MPPLLTDDDFAARMARFGPFERSPAIAVGVSGGRDSMCLALLASRWAAAQGGSLVAITVDHGLRAGSAAEARQVGDWLAGHSIRHRILHWPGPYPASGIQAAARAARYALLSDYCRRHAILHLLVAHHRDDQAETVLIRGERASGRDGLAAMAGVRELPHLRLLRPLLDAPRARLAATLAAGGQDWIDDPSNDNLAMARGRVRMHADGAVLADALALAETCAQERIFAECAMADLAARALRLHAGGYATIDRAELASAPPDIAERLLARTVMAVAGRAYPPRRARTQRLAAAMVNGEPFARRTLGGCRMIGRGEAVVICREAARVAPPVRLAAGADVVWDNRFRASVTKNLAGDARLGALTDDGWAQVVAVDPSVRAVPMPHPARIVLPALWHGQRVAAVPHLGFVNHKNRALTARLRLLWQPPQALAPAPFSKV